LGTSGTRGHYSSLANPGPVQGLFNRLQRVVFRLAPAATAVIVQRQRRGAEGGAIHLDDVLAELAELVGELLLGGADLVRRIRRRLDQHLVEDLLLVVVELGPHMAA